MAGKSRGAFNMKITFLGAAEEVTGSCYLVETGSARFIVDCGMFQGGREASVSRTFAFLDRLHLSLDPFSQLVVDQVPQAGLIKLVVVDDGGEPILAAVPDVPEERPIVEQLAVLLKETVT